MYKSAWELNLLDEELLEQAILAAQVESATGRRYIVLDFWTRMGKAHQNGKR